MTDDEDTPDQWIFPDVTIDAHEYLVIFASEKNRNATDSPLHTNFALDSEGEYLALFDNSLPPQVQSEFSENYPEQSYFHSYGCYGSNDEYYYLSIPTPGEPNLGGKSFSAIVEEPTITPAQGIYNGELSIELVASSSEDTIYYSTDGREPLPGRDKIYTSPISITTNTVIRTRGFSQRLVCLQKQ